MNGDLISSVLDIYLDQVGLKGKVRHSFVAIPDRDEHELLFYSGNYCKRRIDGLVLHKASGSRQATVNMIDAWVRADLSALADQLESVAKDIRKVVLDG